jgi:hypothetical protein
LIEPRTAASAAISTEASSMKPKPRMKSGMMSNGVTK